MDESTLHRKAREAIQAGKLPSRRAESTWGGPGVGIHCAICDKPVKRDEVEFELEFARDDDHGLDTYHLHIRCFAAWEADRRRNLVQVFIWRAGENTTDLIIYNYFRQLSDVGAMQNTLDMPTQMHEAFVAGLAAKLAWKWNRELFATLQTYYRGSDPDKIGGVLQQAMQENRERTDTRIILRR